MFVHVGSGHGDSSLQRERGRLLECAPTSERVSSCTLPRPLNVQPGEVQGAQREGCSEAEKERNVLPLV